MCCICEDPTNHHYEVFLAVPGAVELSVSIK